MTAIMGTSTRRRLDRCDDSTARAEAAFGHHAGLVDPSESPAEDLSLHVRCCVQQDSHWDWFDVSEVFHYLPAAEAAMARFQADFPDRRFRVATAKDDGDQSC